MRDAKAAILGIARRHGRRVMWTDPSMGFGNLLYRYLHAWGERRRGLDAWVLESPNGEPWMDVFPQLQGLTLPRGQLGWRDQRDLEDYQGFGTSFTRPDLEGFARECLLGGGLEVIDDPGGVTINVRRGDFYSSRWRPLYGFDVATYVDRALLTSRRHGPVSHVRFVSDDVAWCQQNLVGLTAGAELVPVSRSGPAADLGTLVGARRLVLANSTFSYWAGFLSNVLHGDNYTEVIAPRFHRRDINGGKAWHLDRRWTVIDDPDGWPPA